MQRYFDAKDESKVLVESSLKMINIIALDLKFNLI